MNASQALTLSKENWAENEAKYLASIVGYQDKVENAARNGRTGCPIGLVPVEAQDFIAYYFEGMGFYVFFQPASPHETLTWVTWKNIPDSSRAYKENEAMDKFLDNII